MTMRLRITEPIGTLVDTDIERLVVEGIDGWFGLLPHHVDIAAALVPGILLYVDIGGDEVAVAIDEAILVKCGAEVLVSAPRAVTGAELGQLQATVEEVFLAVDERERAARGAVRRLEASFMRRLLDYEEAGHG